MRVGQIVVFFVKEIAETKSFEVNNLAQTNEHPLNLS